MDALPGRLSAIAAPAEQHQVCAAIREGLGGGETEAGVGAGDDASTPREVDVELTGQEGQRVHGEPRATEGENDRRIDRGADSAAEKPGGETHRPGLAESAREASVRERGQLLEVGGHAALTA